MRRAPQIAYDTPYNNSDGLATVDDCDMFNGAIDRYDWKLIGKRELYVPHSTNRFQDVRYRYGDLIGHDCVNPDAVRWELHRVWQVEATFTPEALRRYGRR